MNPGSNDLQLLSINTYSNMATDITIDSEIISLSSQFKLYEIKKNLYPEYSKLGKTFVFCLNVCELNIFQYLQRWAVFGNSVMSVQVLLWRPPVSSFKAVHQTFKYLMEKCLSPDLFTFVLTDWLTACASQGQNLCERKRAYVDSFA